MRKMNRKAFTILELLVVVAIIGIIAIIALPNFVGRIEESKASRELAEINAVEKAIATYYAENGVYPTLQAKDGTLLQPQPIEGAPHNIDFASLVPNYLASLPHFSYWWVDYTGGVYHTEKAIGSVSAGVFTPVTGYTYTLHKSNGTTQVLSGPYTLQAGEYIVGVEEDGTELPKVSSAFKNAKMHPEDPEYVSSIPVTGVTLSKTTTGMLKGNVETLVATVVPSTATNKAVTWTSSNTGVAAVSSSGVVTAVANGTATITVTSVDGNRTATCAVTVTTFTNQAFNYTGSVQTFTVPATGTYQFEVWGAAGGGGVQGGKGAYVKGNVSLTAGQTLSVYVGGQGQVVSGGWNGGGSSGSGTYYGVAYGGGGASDVRSGGTALGHRIIVAGGGGGGQLFNSSGQNYLGIGGYGGALNDGGGAGGVWCCGGPGGGATKTAGGVGGDQRVNGASANGPGVSGTLGQGGNGSTHTVYQGGAGGGGGYYGGGGACGGCGGSAGGGGSSYTAVSFTNTSSTAGNRTGHGYALITYVGP